MRHETQRTARLLARSATLTALLLAAATAGAAPDSVATIRELVEQGQYERAYEHAVAAEERYEGDPEFDFFYGLAALESGHFAEAIFALERVVFAQPDQLRVRLELARAHFLAGNYPAAQVEFQRVLDREPPATVRANINRFLERIEVAQRAQRRDLGAWIDVRLGSDTNINSATDSSTINTPIGNFDLVDDGQEQDDEFLRWEVAGAWREPLTKDSMFDLTGRWQQKNNFSSDTFDLGIGTLEGGYSRMLPNGRFRIGGRVQHVRLDNDQFQDGYGIVGSYDRSLAQDWILSLTGAATALRYEGDAGRDVDQYLGSATLLRPMGQYVHTLTVYGAVEPAQNSQGDFNGRDFYGALYGLTYDAEAIQPFVRLGIQTAEFDDNHPVFGKVRDDTTITATAGVQWTLWEDFVLMGQANYTDVDSNLPVFEYDRFLVEFGLRQMF